MYGSLRDVGWRVWGGGDERRPHADVLCVLFRAPAWSSGIKSMAARLFVVYGVEG